MHRKFLLTIVVVLISSAAAFGQCINEPGKTLVFVPIGDLTTQTWTNDNVYVLQGPTWVPDGVTLTILPGTIIKGITGLPPGSVATLTVSRGGKIIADGTPSEPIIFTACTDDVSDPFDLGPLDKGLWGSLILLGRAPINGTVTPPEVCPTNFIEGLPPSPKSIYGGCDAFDNSGIVRYVQLKHGGSIIGAANEINGLTMGGVGKGTIIEYVEVFANLDDCFEWFGGTVDGRYLIGAFGDDDDFDWDQGYTGRLQFLFSIKDSTKGDRGFEIDSDDDNADTEPYARAVVYNVTCMGSGQVLPSQPSNQNAAIHAKENTAGHIRNSIFYEWPRNGLFIEDQAPPSFSLDPIPDCQVLGGEIDCEWHSRCPTGPYADPNWVGGYVNENPIFAVSNLTIFGTIWCAINPNPLTPALLTSNQIWTEQRLLTDWPALGGVIASIPGGSWDNVIANPLFLGNDRSRSRIMGERALDPRPAAGGPAFTIGLQDAPAEDPWFYSAPYAGAFDATNNWMVGWTTLWQSEFLNPNAPTTIVCGDADGNGLVTIGDAVYLITHIFGGGPAPGLPTAADADCNGLVTIGDAVYLITHIFGGGPAPCANCPCP